MTHKQRLVIIGNGMAGARLVEDILQQGGGAAFEIVVFGEEPYGNYNRILLSNVLAGTHDINDIFINSLAWYEEHGITLHCNKRVCAIDRQARLVRAEDGTVEHYDKLVIATGSTPYIPQLENFTAEEDSSRPKQGIFTFRTIDDCNQMIEYAGHARTAIVLGGGLLGLEAAHGLLDRGLEVHVSHTSGHPMSVQLDAPAGAILKTVLERRQVNFHLQKVVKGVLGNGKVTGVTFQNGGTLDCDMLVISTGIRPNVELARQAGLAIERGIIVNDDLSCQGEPDIYAIGECAQHRGCTYGLVAPLWAQARILAERLSNEASSALYEGSQVATKLKVMGVELTMMGVKEPVDVTDEVVTYAEPVRGVYKKLIIRENRLSGAILMGER